MEPLGGLVDIDSATPEKRLHTPRLSVGTIASTEFRVSNMWCVSAKYCDTVSLNDEDDFKLVGSKITRYGNPPPCIYEQQTGNVDVGI